MAKNLSCIIIFLFACFFSPWASFAQSGERGLIPSNREGEHVRILLVPGHDNESWGAQYGNLKEAAMNVAVSSRIFNILKKDERFEMYITRDAKGYTKEFAEYFNLKEDIISFRENARQEMRGMVERGSFVEKEDTVGHNKVNESTSVVLYGINKWANENNINAVIHVHFNDHVRRSRWAPGIYKGFAIYIPEEQLPNAFKSRQLAESIFTELKKKYVTSTHPKEKEGLIPGQSLIALGSYISLDQSVRSVLIEYGYIYRFGNSIARHGAYDTMSKLTAEGIKNYFFPKISEM